MNMVNMEPGYPDNPRLNAVFQVIDQLKNSGFKFGPGAAFGVFFPRWKQPDLSSVEISEINGQNRINYVSFVG